MLRSVWSMISSVSAFSVAGLALVAFAAMPANAQAPAGTQPSMFTQVVPFVVMFGVMYFFMIRPQMRKQKEHQAFLSKLERGSEVITTSGILGRIEGLTDTTVTLEIAPSVRIKVLRNAIAGSAKAATATVTPEVRA